MPSHLEYIKDQDAEQLAHLIEVASQRREDLIQGGWVVVWVVADYANKGWFHRADYAHAVEFLSCLAQHHRKTGKFSELSLSEERVRPAEVEELYRETAKEVARLTKSDGCSPP